MDKAHESWQRYLADKKIDPGCRACEFYHANNEVGDYGTVYSSDPECAKHPTYSNLPTFPFEKVMPCFTLDFWNTPFPDLFLEEEFSDVPIAEVYRLFYVPWREQGAGLAELILWETEHKNKE